MLRNIMMTGTAICLSMGSSLAQADHGDALRYVVGGAIIGAAIGELAYSSGHHGHVVVDYGYRPYPYYAYPGRYYAGPRMYRRWQRWHGPRFDRGHRRGHHRVRHRHH